MDKLDVTSRMIIRDATARVFGVTHLGGVLDGTIQEGGELQTGADFRWSAESKLLVDGWQADLQIPVEELQISPGAIPRIYLVYRSMSEKVEVLSNGNPGDHGACMLCAGVEVKELAGKLPSQEFQLQPGLYVLSGQERNKILDKNNYQDIRATVTGTWRVSPQLELRGTIHPNYAETEPDVPVLRYGQAFAPELMEKRQFFARSTEFLETPGLSLINTRSMAQPKAALAAEYRSEGWRGVGLVAQDAEGGTQLLPGSFGSTWRTAPASDNAFFKGHWSGPSADAGFLLASRQYKTGEDNTVVAIDGLRRFGEDWSARGLLSLSQSRVCAFDAVGGCARQEGHAARFGVRKAQSLEGYGLTYMEISPGFRSDLGWIGQAGFRNITLDGFKRFENVSHSVSGVSLRPQVLMSEDWQGKSIRQAANLETELDLQDGALYARINLMAHSKERLRSDGDLFNSRHVEGVLIVSPGVVLSRVAFVVRAGELPDYYNGRSGQGRLLMNQLTGALTSDLGYLLTVQDYRTRSPRANIQSGYSYVETNVQALLNWQYATLSRWRYVVDMNQQRGLDIEAAGPFRQRYRAHSLLWEHAPRQGLRMTAGVTRVQTGQSRTLELLLKAAYAF